MTGHTKHWLAAGGEARADVRNDLVEMECEFAEGAGAAFIITLVTLTHPAAGLGGRIALAHALDCGIGRCKAQHLVAVASGGGCTSCIVGKETGAGQRRVTDPPGVFERHSRRGRHSRHVAGTVAAHTAKRIVGSGALRLDWRRDLLVARILE